jgi:hypothetical protein
MPSSMMALRTSINSIYVPSRLPNTSAKSPSGRISVAAHGGCSLMDLADLAQSSRLRCVFRIGGHQGSGRLVLTHGRRDRRAFPRSVENAERHTDRSVLRPDQVHYVGQPVIRASNAPHLRVCLVPHNIEDGTAAPLNVERPCAILMPAPCEVAPIVGVASRSGGAVPCAFGRRGCYEAHASRFLLSTARGTRHPTSPGAGPHFRAQARLPALQPATISS